MVRSRLALPIGIAVFAGFAVIVAGAFVNGDAAARNGAAIGTTAIVTGGAGGDRIALVGVGIASKCTTQAIAVFYTGTNIDAGTIGVSCANRAAQSCSAAVLARGAAGQLVGFAVVGDEVIAIAELAASYAYTRISRSVADMAGGTVDISGAPTGSEAFVITTTGISVRAVVVMSAFVVGDTFFYEEGAEITLITVGIALAIAGIKAMTAYGAVYCCTEFGGEAVFVEDTVVAFYTSL